MGLNTQLSISPISEQQIYHQMSKGQTGEKTMNKKIIRVPEEIPKIDLKEWYDILKNPKKHIQKTKSMLKIPENCQILKGDILGVTIDNKVSLGIYTEQNQIIFFRLGDDRKCKDNILIHSSLHEFLKGQRDFFVLDTNLLLEEAKNPYLFNKFLFKELQLGEKFRYLTIYSPEETIFRAKSKIGIDILQLSVQNCNHIAFWSKTGGNYSVECLSIAYRIYQRL